jgi:serine/threonine-protein kinase
MLTGRRLREADNRFELCACVREGRADRPSEYRELPPALETIVMRGLAVDPADRYQTAQKMVADLIQRTRLATRADVTRWLEAPRPHRP